MVGVAGVLAFSMSARTREFGIRLAIGSQPRDIVQRVIGEGAGLRIGIALQKLATSWFEGVEMPGVLVIVGGGGGGVGVAGDAGGAGGCGAGAAGGVRAKRK